MSRKKYGKSRIMRQRLFSRLTPYIVIEASFATDEHRHCPVLLRTRSLQGKHTQFKSIRGCVTGQSELTICALIHCSVLTIHWPCSEQTIPGWYKKTWCATNKINQLANHPAIYSDYHSRVLLTVGHTTDRSKN